MPTYVSLALYNIDASVIMNRIILIDASNSISREYWRVTPSLVRDVITDMPFVPRNFRSHAQYVIGADSAVPVVLNNNGSRMLVLILLFV